MLFKWESKCSLIFFMRATYWPNDLRLGLPRILPTELWFWLPEWAPEPLLQHLPCCVWKEMRKRSSAAASHPPYWWNPAPLPEWWWYVRLMNDDGDKDFSVYMAFSHLDRTNRPPDRRLLLLTDINQHEPSPMLSHPNNCICIFLILRTKLKHTLHIQVEEGGPPRI